MGEFFFRSPFLILLFFLASCGGNPIPSGKTLVEVNGKKITEGDLNFLSGINANVARQLATPFGKKQILDNLVEQELLYQASKQEGIDHDPTVKAKIDLYKKVILAQAYVESTTLKEAKKYYQEKPGEFEKLKLSHIMIRFATPEELKAAKKTRDKSKLKGEREALELANKIYDQLKEGGDFVKLAQEFSEDERTKEGGGDLGSVSKEDLRLTRRGFQPLLEKAFQLKVGEFAGPIKTTSGYHLITVTESPELVLFEEVREQLLFKMRGDIRGKILERLKEKVKVAYP